MISVSVWSPKHVPAEAIYLIFGNVMHLHHSGFERYKKVDNGEPPFPKCAQITSFSTVETGSIFTI